jgi:hypothetical protein
VRIRQVRPEFWTDETMALLAYPVRLFYIGLWNVADDAGWMEWRPNRIGAVLFPYESPKRRERDITAWAERLVEVGRLVIHECGCAQVPTLSKHQRVSGKQSFTAFDGHSPHALRIGKQSPLSDSPVEEGRGTERNGMPAGDPFATRDEEDRIELTRLATKKALRA